METLFLNCIEFISVSWWWLGPLLLACTGVLAIIVMVRFFQEAMEDFRELETLEARMQRLNLSRGTINAQPMSHLSSQGQR